MDGIQAAVLSVKLKHLNRGNDLRRAHARRYTDGLADIGQVVTPVEASYAKHVYHVYAIRVQERPEVMRTLSEKGIGYGVHYPVPIHLQEAYRHLGYEKGAFPVAEATSEEFISLPMFPSLTEAQLDLVVEAVKDCLAAPALN